MVLPDRCPACAAPDPRPWRRMPGSEPDDDATYLLVRCAACGTAATVGDPPPPEAHATGAYAPGPPPRASRAAAHVLAAFDAQRLRILRGAVAPPARLLDAGAGKGRFVLAARAAGYDAIGIEPSPRAPAEHVLPTAIEDFAPDTPFDVISLWHVLEHLEDPDAAMARVRHWLRPDGGALLVGVPNLDSLQARVGGPRWYHLDLPRHRTHFTERGLRALVRRHGLSAVRTHQVLAEHNPFGLWQSAVSRVTPTPSWLYHALKHNARLSILDALPTAAALPLVPVAGALEAAAGATQRGGTIALVATTAPSRR